MKKDVSEALRLNEQIIRKKHYYSSKVTLCSSSSSNRYLARNAVFILTSSSSLSHTTDSVCDCWLSPQVLKRMLDLKDQVELHLTAGSLIRFLHCCIHRFTSFPEVLYQIVSLETVLLGNNQVNMVDPCRLRTLVHLSTLDLSNNDLLKIPPELGLCTSLRYVWSTQLVPHLFMSHWWSELEACVMSIR